MSDITAPLLDRLSFVPDVVLGEIVEYLPLQELPELRFVSKRFAFFKKIQELIFKAIAESYQRNNKIFFYIQTQIIVTMNPFETPPNELVPKVYKKVVEDARLYLLDPETTLSATKVKYRSTYSEERLQAVIQEINKKRAQDTIVFFGNVIREFNVPALADWVVTAELISTEANWVLKKEMQGYLLEKNSEAYSMQIRRWLSSAAILFQTITKLKLKPLVLNNSPLIQSRPITYLPRQIFDLPNLEVLDLSNNRLKAIPPEIRQLHSLQRLYLANNPLQSLPITLKQLNCAIFQKDPVEQKENES